METPKQKSKLGQNDKHSLLHWYERKPLSAENKTELRKDLDAVLKKSVGFLYEIWDGVSHCMWHTVANKKMSFKYKEKNLNSAEAAFQCK